MNSLESYPHISRDVKADNTVKFRGDVFIGKGCSFGSHSIIEGKSGRVVIEDNCTIGNNVTISANQERITIGRGSTIGANSSIHRSIESESVVEENSNIN